MKLITSLSMIFIFCFCIGVGLSNAQGNLDTPFIKKYRPRYEANIKNINLFLIIDMARSECAKKCTEQDKKNIKQLAETGDMFALAMLPWLYDYEERLLLWKNSADRGEVNSAVFYGGTIDNFELATKYTSLAASKGYAHGYTVLATVYVKHNDIPKFCSTLTEAYKKFGIEFLASYFISSDAKIPKLFFSNCTKQKPADILVKKGDEGMLIQGYIYVQQNKYKEAYDIFSQLYKHSDSSKISANAGYCLGMMYYYGTSVTKDIEKGKRLLKEAFDNGVVYETNDTQEQFLLPTKLELIKYDAGNCNKIK